MHLQNQIGYLSIFTVDIEDENFHAAFNTLFRFEGTILRYESEHTDL